MGKILVIILLLTLSGCRYEESANTKSFIHNKSSHSITILPYYNGVVMVQDSVYINSNQISLVLDKNDRGKGTGFSYPDYLAILDSVEVKFDNSIKIIHYSFATSNLKTTNSKTIKYDSSRSLYNKGNYIRTITHEDKRNISNEYTFTFTEQDYLDAAE